MNDPYLILGLLEQKINETLDDKVVKAAYMKLLQKYPPDRKPEQFKQIRKAFEQLETHKKRLKYDLLDITPPDLQDLSILLPDTSLHRPSLKLARQLLG
jgi:curved DNA-binding protein CbpA